MRKNTHHYQMNICADVVGDTANGTKTNTTNTHTRETVDQRHAALAQDQITEARLHTHTG